MTLTLIQPAQTAAKGDLRVAFLLPVTEHAGTFLSGIFGMLISHDVTGSTILDLIV
ncbi:hypothetical protein MUA03_13380 [Enterobacteriaceae bacterium H16N7]|nr:hypothetical protein [Dryocola clanedunensis]